LGHETEIAPDAPREEPTRSVNFQSEATAAGNLFHAATPLIFTDQSYNTSTTNVTPKKLLHINYQIQHSVQILVHSRSFALMNFEIE
jgi:hypothetical protein